MGLGKTVQALALLEERRLAKAGPSLVVVPRSLLFNWRQEATRFTPDMRVLVHEGRDRARDAASFADYDIVLITYGTLRRDAPLLAETEFDYVILDEAQAIKNASDGDGEGGAAAPREASSRDERHAGREPHRRALESVRVPEPRHARRRARVQGVRHGRGGASPAGSLIARAVRPFILRRTKEEVAPELPEKLEQTIYVELEPKERKRYDELRDHYRAALLGRVDREGIAKSKIQILEALLRLRQAACHSGSARRDARERSRAASSTC